MIRQPEIVMREIRDELAACLPQRDVPVGITEVRRLREIEPADAVVIERPHGGGGRVGAAIADHEQLVFEIRPHWIAVVPSILWTIALIVFWVVGYQIAKNQLDGGAENFVQNAVAIVALGLAWWIVLVGHDRPASRKLDVGKDVDDRADRWARVRRLTWSALPLGFSALLVSLNTSIPRLCEPCS